MEKIFRAHVIQLLVELDLLPHDRLRLLHSWKNSGFNVRHGESIPPENTTVLEQLAQYILSNPFSVAKMTLHSGGENVIYRSQLNPKINRNLEIFTAPDFLATITQHIPDSSLPPLASGSQTSTAQLLLESSALGPLPESRLSTSPPVPPTGPRSR